MTQSIRKNILIGAQRSTVWLVLTNADLMKQWMGEPEMDIEIITGWTVGGDIVIRGFHHIKFENKGRVLQFETNHVLKYNYLSSLSRLPDTVQNYTIVEFQLTASNDDTSLSLIVTNFPTEEIYKHVEFYWITCCELALRSRRVRRPGEDFTRRLYID